MILTETRAVLTITAGAMLLAVVGTLAAGAAITGDVLALGCLLGAVGVPVGLIFVERAIAWDGRHAYRMIIVLTIILSAVFRLRAIDDKSIDVQIMLKLLAIGLTGLMAAVAILRIGLRNHDRAFFVWCAFFVYMMLTSFITATPALALVETSSNLAAFLLLYGAACLLNRENLVRALIASCLILCLLSITAYVIVPSLGRMSDWVNGAFVPTWRLQGVFGTANAAGGAAAVGIILALLTPALSGNRWLRIAALGVFAACLLLSNNRMAMAGLGAALLYANWVKGNQALKLAIAAFVVSLVLLAYLGTGDELLELLSRSGSSDEITSGTGRTRIWSVVLQLWSEQPLFGYGAGAAKYILPKNPLLFAAAAHAHNLFLNILFSGGVVGLLLFVYGVGAVAWRAASGKDHRTIALLIFFMVYGITEPTIGGLVSFVPMAFCAAVILGIAPPPGRVAGGSRNEPPRQWAPL
ncbi:O-antigen ligase family protein [Bosea sp. AS-1]|uniref:O-antigen ligase family protein n=1 Tax=Bosea sp. AS-1 TaxID=2015316 RepID=UPI000B77D711|nr:O-antigen ligase family protein [Bosea sp. AS-1]